MFRKIFKNMSNKTIIIILFILIVLLILFLYYKYFKEGILEFVLEAIITGIAINIISEILIFYLLENKKEKERIKKIKIMIKCVLTNEIKQFLYFVFCMYKAVSQIDESAENIFNNIEALYNKLLSINLNNTTILENTFKIVTKDDSSQEMHINSKTWGQTFKDRIYKYRQRMEYIRDSYSYIIDSQMYINITDLLYSYDNFSVKSEADKIYINTGFYYNTELVFNDVQFKTTLYQTIELCKTIKEHYDIDVLEEMKFILQGMAIGVKNGERFNIRFC